MVLNVFKCIWHLANIITLSDSSWWTLERASSLVLLSSSSSAWWCRICCFTRLELGTCSQSGVRSRSCDDGKPHLIRIGIGVEHGGALHHLGQAPGEGGVLHGDEGGRHLEHGSRNVRDLLAAPQLQLQQGGVRPEHGSFMLMNS